MSNQERSLETNSGPGWYEVIHPSKATTHIAYVHEDGSIYFPEGVQLLDRHEFAFAAAQGNAHRLVRASECIAAEDDVTVHRVASAIRDAYADEIINANGDLDGVSVTDLCGTAEEWHSEARAAIRTLNGGKAVA